MAQAIEIIEDFAAKQNDKKIRKFASDLVVHVRVAQSRLMHEAWTPDLVSRSLMPAIQALEQIQTTQDLNYMIAGDVAQAVLLLKKIVKNSPKKINPVERNDG